MQNSEKSAVKKVVESYLNKYVKYNMLPEAYRVASPNIPRTAIDSYVTKMEGDIKSYFTPNDNSYKFMTDMLENNLDSQKSEATVIFSYNKTISKYTAFNFNNSNVTVTFDTNTSYDGPDPSDPTAGRLKLNAVTTDSVVLKKVDGNWKIVYSNINRPSQRNSFGGGIRVKMRHSLD
jgi:predicted double-glycine peptidase